MVTENGLAIVRAALQYFDEEISPSGDDVLQHYLDDRGFELGLTVADIKPTRGAFDNAALFFATKKLDLNELDSVELIPASTPDDLSYFADRVQLVSVLAPTK